MLSNDATMRVGGDNENDDDDEDEDDDNDDEDMTPDHCICWYGFSYGAFTIKREYEGEKTKNSKPNSLEYLLTIPLSCSLFYFINYVRIHNR